MISCLVLEKRSVFASLTFSPSPFLSLWHTQVPPASSHIPPLLSYKSSYIKYNVLADCLSCFILSLASQYRTNRLRSACMAASTPCFSCITALWVTLDKYISLLAHALKERPDNRASCSSTKTVCQTDTIKCHKLNGACAAKTAEVRTQCSNPSTPKGLTFSSSLVCWIRRFAY